LPIALLAFYSIQFFVLILHSIISELRKKRKREREKRRKGEKEKRRKGEKREKREKEKRQSQQSQQSRCSPFLIIPSIRD